MQVTLCQELNFCDLISSGAKWWSKAAKAPAVDRCPAVLGETGANGKWWKGWEAEDHKHLDWQYQVPPGVNQGNTFTGQGTALKAGRLTWKRKAEAPKGRFDRWMMAFLLPLFLSLFLFVLIFESFGRWRQAHWQNRWMVVNGSVAEGRSSVADRCVVIGQWRSSHWKVSVTITIVSKSRHGLKPSWPWSIGQIWPTPVLGLDIGQLKCAMFIVNVKWEIWNWCSVMHFFASTINSRTTYKDQ